MATHEAKRLIRDPAEWATDNGWISRRRALNIGRNIGDLIEAMDGAVGDDDGFGLWLDELHRIRKAIAPEKTPVEKRLARRADDKGDDTP